jgi:hypothetical protein
MRKLAGINEGSGKSAESAGGVPGILPGPAGLIIFNFIERKKCL